MLDRERLIKLLGMTTSSSDNEALVALRMVNKMLSEEKLTWGEILAAGRGTTLSVTVSRSPQQDFYRAPEGEEWQAPHLRDKAIIDTMFRTIYSVPIEDDQFRRFVDSVHQWYRDRGALTQAQYTAIRNTYNRVRRKA